VDEITDDDVKLLRAYVFKLKHNITDEAFSDLGKLNPSFNTPTWKVASRRIAILAKFAPRSYDCCINVCLLYAGVHEDRQRCIHCHEPRFKPNGQPRKQFNYLPIIPRLQALYSDPEMVQKMAYRGTFQQHDKTMEDIYDSAIYNMLCDTPVTIGGQQLPHHFFSEDTDIALGVATDGFAPFRNRKQTCWPILVYNLNLPPDLCFLLPHLLCVGVVPGPKKPKDFDSFLYPFVEEMLELSIGVNNTKHACRETTFTLRAYLLWGSGDMPAVSMMLRSLG
jgi:Transposase family tnp2